MSSKCLRCGKCCKMFSYVEKILGDDRDAVLMRRIFRRRDPKNNPGGYTCRMLHVDKKTKKATCLIYAARPRVCRLFLPGDATCEITRRQLRKSTKTHDEPKT